MTIKKIFINEDALDTVPDELLDIVEVLDDFPQVSRGQAILILTKIFDQCLADDDLSSEEWQKADLECIFTKSCMDVIGEDGEFVSYHDLLKPFGVTQKELSACLPPEENE